MRILNSYLQEQVRHNFVRSAITPSGKKKEYLLQLVHRRIKSLKRMKKDLDMMYKYYADISRKWLNKKPKKLSSISRFADPKPLTPHMRSGLEKDVHKAYLDVKKELNKIATYKSVVKREIDIVRRRDFDKGGFL